MSVVCPERKNYILQKKKKKRLGLFKIKFCGEEIFFFVYFLFGEMWLIIF